MANIVDFVQERTRLCVEKILTRVDELNEENDVRGISVVVMRRDGNNVVSNYLESETPDERENLALLMEVGKQALDG